MIASNKLRFTQVLALALASAASACTAEPASHESTGTDDVTSIQRTSAKQQSIANCWLYATASWTESLHLRVSDAQLDVYGVFELQTLEKVLRDSRPEAIGPVAAAIRRKIGAPDDREHDYAFLTAYYNAARARMERGLLFGKRRLDKYDTGGGG